MAQPQRLLTCGALLLCACALLHCDSLLAKVPAPPAPSRLEAAQHRIANSVAVLVLSLLKAFFSLLPGLALASVLAVGYSQRQRLTSRVRGGLVLLLLAGLGASLVQRRYFAGEAAGAPAEQVRADAAAIADAGEVPEVTPLSGEEVLMSDGRFVRLADPGRTDGGVTAEWRQGLARALVTAIAQGQEQVVIMFTRQGCPWCDRQLPVLQEAIRRRAGGVRPPANTAPPALNLAPTFVAPGGAAGAPGVGSLLNAPLRVFVLDAGEFPHLIEQFRIEAFPTSLVFGRPRVAPLLGRGFLDDETFESVCREAALAEPEPEEQAPKRKKRRGLFGFR